MISMRFRRFRIRNYRSLVDTGWNNLATDNITGIIGQNESGKTSILEALYSFYTGKINDDILRSDLSLPAVYCSFETNLKQLYKLIKGKKLPEQVIDSIEETGLVTIGRCWENEKISSLTFGDDKLLDYFNKQLAQKLEFERKVEEEVLRVINEADRATEEYQLALKEKNDEQKLLSSMVTKQPKIQKAFDRSPDKENSSRLEKFMLELERTKKRLDKKNRTYEMKLEKATDLAEKARYARWCLKTVSDYKAASVAYQESLSELNNAKERFENLSGFRKIKRARSRIEFLENRYREYHARMENTKSLVSTRKAVASRILKGMNPAEAEEMAEKENEKTASFYTQQELAEEIFMYIPVFEMFEDFSSLLPNRIDIDDVFAGKSHVEGYKAARNFLTVANLDENFFDVLNSRILHQKIEKLNNEVTLTFQDYWHQNLGEQDKIRINFELEHYDSSYPDKMGKPYLEFWIKDSQESLYPKQRSRGVRWFLSFYLELKASAILHRERSRVFLIDEPGLSLHARAQEDVLKVLEDVKDNIQIIYTTHSPHLINVTKLYRLLAVQRSVEGDMKSGTIIFDAQTLNKASPDTLAPIYTLIGTKLNEHQFIQNKNNLIVEDITTFHYLKTIFNLIEFHKDIFFLPATDVLNVPALVNLLIGWKIDFIVLLDDDDSGNIVYNDLKVSLFQNSNKLAGRKIIKLDNKIGIEDLFSKNDFKNIILHQRANITGSNLDYIENNNLSRNLLASNFILHSQNNKIKFEDFDEETRENISILVHNLDNLLE
jgi:predicted ATP-dependent endonuclease of OLD family